MLNTPDNVTTNLPYVDNNSLYIYTLGISTKVIY